MPETYTLTPIAHIQNDFPEKFGIPRQSGLVEELRARIVFEPAFRSADAVRGLETYSHLWLIWQFSAVVDAGQDGANWRPTVRPPRLGATPVWGCLPPAAPSGPTRWGFPACGWWGWTPIRPRARC